MLAFAVLKDAIPPNFTEKTFASSHKTTKSTKVFSLKSFLLYSICMCLHIHSGNLVGLQLLNYRTQSYLSWLAAVLNKRSFVRHFGARGNPHPFNPLTFSQTSLNCLLREEQQQCPVMRVQQSDIVVVECILYVV